MALRIDTIKDIPYEFPVSQPIENFPILADMQRNGECTFLGDVTGHITVRREYDHFKATGTVHVPLTIPCSRCLLPVTTTVDSSFTVIYRKENKQNLAPEEETELTEDDLVSTIYSDDELDIEHEIEMQVAMGVPVKQLCSDSCKGLCPGCGVNLSTEPCNCKDTGNASPFSALKNLKFHDN